MPEEVTEYILRKNIERYGLTERQRIIWPEFIKVTGNEQQAQHIAETLSFDEPDCQYFWYVEGVDDV